MLSKHATREWSKIENALQHESENDPKIKRRGLESIKVKRERGGGFAMANKIRARFVAAAAFKQAETNWSGAFSKRISNFRS